MIYIANSMDPDQSNEHLASLISVHNIYLHDHGGNTNFAILAGDRDGTA